MQKRKTQTLELEMRPAWEFKDLSLCTLKKQNGKVTRLSKLMLLGVHSDAAICKSCLEGQHKQLNQATDSNLPCRYAWISKGGQHHQPVLLIFQQ